MEAAESSVVSTVMDLSFLSRQFIPGKLNKLKWPPVVSWNESEPLPHSMQFTKGQDYFTAEQIKHT